MLDVPDRRPVEDVICTDAHYRRLFESAGLEVLDVQHHLQPGKRRRGGSAKQARRPGQSTSWAVIRVYNDASTAIETHKHTGDFRGGLSHHVGDLSEESLWDSRSLPVFHPNYLLH